MPAGGDRRGDRGAARVGRRARARERPSCARGRHARRRPGRSGGRGTARHGRRARRGSARTGELEAALVGASAGDKKDVFLRTRRRHRAERSRSRCARCRRRSCPPLDDELARAASEFDTLDELRKNIEGTLRAQLDAEIDAAYRVSAVDALVEDVEGAARDLRSCRSRAADLLTGFVRSLERRGVSLETYIAASGAQRAGAPAPVRARGGCLHRP